MGKRSKQDFGTQESASAASMESDRSVEEHLTQTSGEDEDVSGKDTERDAQGDGDVGDGQFDRSREDVVMIPPTSGTPSSSPRLVLESSQQDVELNWDEPHSPIRPSLSSSTNPFLESISHPPSQLQLSSPLYHIHRKSSPFQPQTTHTDTNSSVLSLPLNPVALSSPVGFTASTPQRQTWYQPSLRRRVSSRSTSGGTTPKPTSRKHEPTGTLPTVSEDSHSQSASKGKDRVPSTPQSIRESPLARKSVFRSGTLQVTPSHSSVSPLHSQSPSRHQSMASHTNADEGTSIPAIVRDVFTIPEEKIDSCDTQSQFDQQSSLFEDISMSLSSYPPLQTQAPYQSQSFSQLD